MITTNITLKHKELSASSQVAFLQFAVEEKMSFVEGQFVMLETDRIQDHKGNDMKRAYSIGTTNKQLQEDGIIGTIVKKTSETGMSAFLVDTIDVGDSMKLTGPLGHFVDHKHRPNYLLVSVGSGVTPIYSIYKHLVEEYQDYGKIANIYGERHFEHVLPSIADLFFENSEKVQNIRFLSRDDQLPGGRRQGRVQAGLEESLHFVGTDETICFLCGKPEMVDEVREKLEDAGVPKEHIVFEKY